MVAGEIVMRAVVVSGESVPNCLLAGQPQGQDGLEPF